MTTNKVVEEGGKWYVKSKDGKKVLGGPYDTEEEAKKRLREIEYFKNNLRLVTANLAKGCRFDVMEGKQYLVAPVVMLVEGVHEGSDGPLYYPPEELAKTPAVWNHKPIVVYHPTRNGAPVSACDPDILTSRKVGIIMNTEWDTSTQPSRLKAEAWLDVEKLKKVDVRVYDAIENERLVEVSTGLFCDKIPVESGATWNGEEYVAIAVNYRPDHLAILPDKKGACSIEDGAGLLRNQEALEEKALAALKEECGEIHWCHVLEEDAGAIVYNQEGNVFVRRYQEQDEGIVFLSSPEVVYQVSDKSKTPVGTPEQELGKKVFNVKEYRMDEKEQFVNELIANESTPWTEEDKEALLAMPDEQLKKLEQVRNEAPPENPDPDPDPDPDPKESPENKSEQNTMETSSGEKKPMTLEEYISQAPKEIQEVLWAGVLMHNRLKKSLVDAISANERCRFSREELEGKTMQELEALAALAGPPKDKDRKPIPSYVGAGDPVMNVDEEPLVAPAVVNT